MDKTYIRVSPSGEGVTAYCYQSGKQVLDEGIIGGRLICRYRNCSGQIMPEMHITAEAVAQLADRYGPASEFRVAVDGRDLDGNWTVRSFEEVQDTTGLQGVARVYALRLFDDKAKVQVNIMTRLDGSDFIVRWLEIVNEGDRAIGLTAVSPVAGRIWLHQMNFGPHQPYYRLTEVLDAGPAYEIAYNHCKNWGEEGDFYFDPLDMRNFQYIADYGRAGWTRPACWLRDRMTGETLVCELAWSGNWQMRAQIGHQGNAHLSFEMGLLESEGEVLRVLKPGEAAESPAAHMALLRGNDDEIVQLTHEHVRNVVLPPLPESVPISEIEANHRGYLCDRETEEGIKRDIDVASEIEAEMYVVDAGWYGNLPNQWWNNTGDWVAGPWMKNGFEPIPEYAHNKGMRFGLWVEIEAVGANSTLRQTHPDWVMTRHGIPCANGRALNLADPVVEQYLTNEICRLVEQYNLDMYRIDHNHTIGLGGTRQVEGYTENTLWRYYEAFNRIFRTIRAKYPQLVLQNCAGGGGRLDWGTMSLFHNVELSDWMRQPRSTRILSGVTMSLPPEILLRTFGTEVGELLMDGDVDSQLRISMICRPIYRGIAPSVEDLSPYLKERTVYYNALYKRFLRPLMKNCRVYHHTPFQPIMNAAPATILEYASPDRTCSMVAIFTHTPSDTREIVVKPRGVSREKCYRVTFDNTQETISVSGNELVSQGVVISIGRTMSSELLLIEAE